MYSSFLDAAKQGKNQWWRYGCAVPLVLLFWLGLGQFAIAALFPKFPDLQDIPGFSLPVYVCLHLPLIFLLLGIFLAVGWVHQRSITTLVGADARLRWKRLFAGFGVCWFLLVAGLGIRYLLNPQDYVWTFQSGQWFLFLPVVLLLTPLQTSAEELLFRGYLLQSLGLLTRQPAVLVGLTSLPFTIAHFFNPEMQRGAFWVGLIYLTVSLFLALITLKDDRLELALGTHAANNLFILLVANSSDSALPSPALLTIQRDDPQEALATLLVQGAIFYWVFFGRQK
jgi:membrane protease YdiL (CAAX protease family)